MCKETPDPIRILGFALIMTLPLYAAQSADLGAIPIFPADNPWHYDISEYPVHPNSDNFIISVGKNTALHPDFQFFQDLSVMMKLPEAKSIMLSA